MFSELCLYFYQKITDLFETFILTQDVGKGKLIVCGGSSTSEKLAGVDFIYNYKLPFADSFSIKTVTDLSSLADFFNCERISVLVNNIVFTRL